MKSNHLKSPARVYKLASFKDFDTILKIPRVFLAGSIENGDAKEWQSKVVEEFPEDVVFYNPRRDDWDASWKQSITDPQFNEQVTWELDMLDNADFIFLYFDPNTKSPISLLELGLHATSGKLIICCPFGFWRRGNIEMVCDRYNIYLTDSFEEAIKELKQKVNEYYQNKKKEDKSFNTSQNYMESQ